MPHIPRLARLPRVAGLCLLLGHFGLAASVAVGQEPAETEDRVVARIDGEEILLSEVRDYASTLPAQYQLAFDQILPFMVERLIDLRLIDKAAAAQGLAEDEEVREHLESLTIRVMREVYLRRLLEEQVDDAALRARYEAYLGENPPAEEVHARHILLESEDEARAVIAELDGGADFVDLATNRSTGPSAAQGGDLGYFVADQMVPEFSAAAFALEPGGYTSEPVQSQFGWHVILLVDRRMQSPPAFEDVEDELREELQGAAVESHIAGLRSAAEIEVLVPKPGEEAGAAEDGGEEPAEEGAEEAQ